MATVTADPTSLYPLTPPCHGRTGGKSSERDGGIRILFFVEKCTEHFSINYQSSVCENPHFLLRKYRV